MQNKKALLISLAVALFALMLVFSYISKREAALLELSTPIKAVFAVKDIPQGTRLDASLLEEREVPKKYVQPGAIGELSEVVDRTVIVPILKDTQILEAMFTPTMNVGIAAKIPKEMRAFSVAVADVTAVADLIQPGDFVDLLVTVEFGSFQEGHTVSEEIMTKTILENVLVLAVNRKSSKSQIIERVRVKQPGAGNVFAARDDSLNKREKLRTLTVALSPENTQRVSMAQEVGTISVALRSTWDKGERVSIPPLSARQLLGIEKNVVPKSRPAWLEIRGVEREIFR